MDLDQVQFQNLPRVLCFQAAEAWAVHNGISGSPLILVREYDGLSAEVRQAESLADDATY